MDDAVRSWADRRQENLPDTTGGDPGHGEHARRQVRYNRAMASFSPPNVLILVQNPETARHLAEQLHGAAEQVWLSTVDVAAGEVVEILVTDLPARPRDAASRLTQDAGVVGIDRADWADVKLSPQFSRDELRTACVLLAEIVRLRVTTRKITKVEHEIRHLAHTDPLTELPNRRAWDLQLPLIWKAAHATGEPIWLAVVDLDGLKRVNDAGGLARGDEALRAASRAMAAALRRDDLIARIGGDEFGVLFSGASEAGAAAALERLRAAVAGHRMPQPVGRLTVSIGYAGDVAGDVPPDNLFAAAERGLRDAKQADGNRVVRGDVRDR